MLMRLNRKEKGIGLLELMLSLAIIAVLLIMATRYYQSTRRSSQLNQIVQTTNAYIAAIETWKAGRTKPGEVLTDAALTTAGSLRVLILMP